MFVALLRGINVSGHNKVPMKDLKALVEALPATNVATYLQSGNVVFRSSAGDEESVAAAIGAGIKDEMGLDVTVLVRTGQEVADVMAANPMPQDVAHLHVTFLAAPPGADLVAAAAGSPVATSAAPDRFEVIGRQVYVSCPDGYGRTKLNNAFFERKLRQGATTRNWRTVTTLAEMATR